MSLGKITEDLNGSYTKIQVELNGPIRTGHEYFIVNENEKNSISDGLYPIIPYDSKNPSKNHFGPGRISLPIQEQVIRCEKGSKIIVSQMQQEMELSILADKLNQKPKKISEPYVDPDRIQDLKEINHSKFDLSKLIRLCEELNSNFKDQNYFAVAILVRAIKDHTPPVFKFKEFKEVANNYKGDGSSFRSNMMNLERSLKNIADSFLHDHIRRKEKLPTKIQVDFRQDLDRLIEEIIRILR